MITISTSCKTPPNAIEELDAPAFYYGVVSPEGLLYHSKKGNLSVTSDRPIDDHSQFALYSITKTFTAIAIMQLVENEDLKLDDLAIEYLPQYEFLEEITIRHLLTHQSGINNPLPTKWIHLAEEDEGFDFQDFNDEILTQKAKIKFEVGSKSSYSNINFIVLGEIISTVTGLSYHEYINTYVLNNPEIGFSWKKQNVVTGYHPSGIQGFILGFLLDKNKYTEEKTDGLIPFKKLNLNGSAHGGLLASANGLNVFLQELLKQNNAILSEDMKQQMFKEQRTNDLEPSGHSLGWFTGSLNGEKYAHHPGGGGGFYVELRVYPNKGIATYLLTNKSGFSDKGALDQLDASYFKHH